jgi:hypothetical protein
LLNVAYNIFAIILNQRLVDTIEAKLGDYQSGFRPDRSTIDNIFIIRQIIEKCLVLRSKTPSKFSSFQLHNGQYEVSTFSAEEETTFEM